jgi:hypothetical protein
MKLQIAELSIGTSTKTEYLNLQLEAPPNELRAAYANAIELYDYQEVENDDYILNTNLDFEDGTMGNSCF